MIEQVPVAFAFSLAIADSGSNVDASCSVVDGLTKFIWPREAGENRFVHQLPSGAKNTKITARQGLMVATSEMFSWCKDTLLGDLDTKITTHTLTVSVRNERQEPVVTWTLSDCWPVSWSVSSSVATNNRVAFETVEFAYTTMPHQRFDVRA